MMSQEEMATSVQPEGGQRPVDFWQQILLVFSDPAKAFKELTTNPRWIGAFLVVLLFTVAGTQATYPLIMQMQRDSIMQNPRISEEQADILLERYSSTPGPGGRAVMTLAQTFGLAVWLVVMSGILMFGGNILLGGESNFKTLMAIAAHSWLVLVPKTLLTVPLMLAKGSMAVSTSLQILIPSDQWMTPLGSALGAVDLFTIWTIVLIVIGISEAYRFTRVKSAALVVSLYMVMVVIGVALTALGRGLMSGQ